MMLHTPHTGIPQCMPCPCTEGCWARMPSMLRMALPSEAGFGFDGPLTLNHLLCVWFYTCTRGMGLELYSGLRQPLR